MEVFKEFFGNCWLCSAPTFNQIQICQHCKLNIPEPEMLTETSTKMPFRTVSLWDWTNTKNSWAYYLLQNLKYKERLSIHRWLARYWLEQELKPRQGEKAISSVLVPCPSPQIKKPNHSLSLLLALNEYLQLPILDLLVHPGKEQKNQSKYARKQLKFSRKAKGRMPTGVRYIFVDDVITTGSTAMAAYRALNKPQDFEAWTLFYRSSCPKERGLI